MLKKLPLHTRIYNLKYPYFKINTNKKWYKNRYLFLFKGAYWISSNIAIAILNFSLLIPIYLSLFQLCLSLCFNFCISFVDWFMASFLYCFPYSYRSSKYCDSNSCRSFTLLKALAKSKSTHIAFAFKSEKEQ